MRPVVLAFLALLMGPSRDVATPSWRLSQGLELLAICPKGRLWRVRIGDRVRGPVTLLVSRSEDPMAGSRLRGPRRSLSLSAGSKVRIERDGLHLVEGSLRLRVTGVLHRLGVGPVMLRRFRGVARLRHRNGLPEVLIVRGSVRSGVRWLTAGSAWRHCRQSEELIPMPWPRAPWIATAGDGIAASAGARRLRWNAQDLEDIAADPQRPLADRQAALEMLAALGAWPRLRGLRRAGLRGETEALRLSLLHSQGEPICWSRLLSDSKLTPEACALLPKGPRQRALRGLSRSERMRVQLASGSFAPELSSGRVLGAIRARLRTLWRESAPEPPAGAPERLAVHRRLEVELGLGAGCRRRESRVAAPLSRWAPAVHPSEGCGGLELAPVAGSSWPRPDSIPLGRALASLERERGRLDAGLARWIGQVPARSLAMLAEERTWLGPRALDALACRALGTEAGGRASAPAREALAAVLGAGPELSEDSAGLALRWRTLRGTYIPQAGRWLLPWASGRSAIDLVC